MLYKTLFAAFAAVAFAQDLDDVADVVNEVPDAVDIMDLFASSLDPLNLLMDFSEIAMSMIPDEVLAILGLASPDTLSCDGTDDVICGLVDWLECNTDPDISRCMVPCNDAGDCVIEGVEGTGFSTCDTDLTDSTADGYEGWCLPNSDGDCIEDDDCPSIVGFSCDGGS